MTVGKLLALLFLTCLHAAFPSKLCLAKSIQHQSQHQHLKSHPPNITSSKTSENSAFLTATPDVYPKTTKSIMFLPPSYACAKCPCPFNFPIMSDASKTTSFSIHWHISELIKFVILKVVAPTSKIKWFIWNKLKFIIFLMRTQRLPFSARRRHHPFGPGYPSDDSGDGPAPARSIGSLVTHRVSSLSGTLTAVIPASDRRHPRYTVRWSDGTVTTTASNSLIFGSPSTQSSQLSQPTSSLPPSPPSVTSPVPSIPATNIRTTAQLSKHLWVLSICELLAQISNASSTSNWEEWQTLVLRLLDSNPRSINKTQQSDEGQLSQTQDLNTEIQRAIADAVTLPEFDAVMRSMFNELSVGHVGRAARKLEQSKMLDLTDDIKRQITELYQPPNPTSSAQWDNPDVTSIPRFTPDAVTSTIFSKSRFTSGGIDGWTYADLQLLLRLSKTTPNISQHQRTRLPIDLTKLIQDIADGIPLKCPILLESFRTIRGFPLAKPNGKPRPIGVGSTFLQLAGTMLVRHPTCRQDLVDTCGPTEYIFGINGGTEAVPHACRAYLALNQHKVGIKVDVKSAFNNVSEESIAMFAHSHPAFSGYCRIRCEGTRTANFLDRNRSCELSVKYSGGFDQGDPLATAAYPSIQSIAVSNTLSRHPNVRMIGLADDKTLWGDLGDVFAAFDTYTSELRSLGLTVNPQKCVATSQDGVEHIFARCQASGISAQDGFLIAGSPIGTDRFTQDHVISEVNRIRDLVKLVFFESITFFFFWRKSSTRLLRSKSPGARLPYPLG